jgi:hypothetical protein
MDGVKEFQILYKSHLKGKQNRTMIEYLFKKIEEGKFTEFFNDSYFRTNSKSKFFTVILSEKKKRTWPNEVKILFRKLFAIR